MWYNRYRKEVCFIPASKAQQKAVNKYMTANYDRINLTVPKGRKAEIKAHADTLGESVNGFINRAVSEAMGEGRSEEALECSTSPSLAQGIVLPHDAKKAAGEAVKATGENLTEFVARSVGEQAKRDKISLQMGIDPVTGAKLTPNKEQ